MVMQLVLGLHRQEQITRIKVPPMATKRSASESPPTPRKRTEGSPEKEDPKKDIKVKGGICPDHTVWIPSDVYTLASSGSSEEIKTVERTVHWDDYEEDEEAGRPVSHPIKGCHRSRLPDGTEGLWIGLPEGEDNWYGNVTYEILFDQFFDQFIASGKYKVYFLEVVQYNSFSSSRFLITKETNEKYSEYDWERNGGPWRHTDGKHMYSNRIRQYDTDNDTRNELEIFFQVQEEDISALKAMITKKPAHHEQANNGGYHKCHKFRSGGRTEECKSPWTPEETRQKMDELQKKKNNDKEKSFDD
ncbi:uncharacterized protein LOC122265552 [Penaeus japonicus]|uniref:uncharacterized protein LOC122265552 n=1 Tax=Penaeus japonicus TaxID=27405 RepID=UPI001C7143EF|nr:uncharacterized protein LOC122265552 [Penaeus japonicus]